MTRIRTRGHDTTVVGSYHKSNLLNATGTTVTQIRTLSQKEWCKDEVQSKPFFKAQPLHLTREIEGVIRVSGQVEHKILGMSINKDSYQGYPVTTVVPSYGLQALVPMASYTSAALARAIPNQSETDLAEAVKQLPEIVRSLMILKDLIFDLRKFRFRSSTIGSAYLANEFGIKPLINDLRTYCTIADQLNNAAKQHNRAERGISSKGVLIREKDEWTEDYVFLSTWSSHTLRLLNTYQMDVWYSVRFLPNGKLAPHQNVRTLSYFGLDKPLVSLWNNLPWSFLVDYIIGIGDYLESEASSHKVRDICIMRHRKATKKLTDSSEVHELGLYRIEDNNLKFHVRKGLRETKQRVVYADTVGVPIKLFLTAKQSTNILALLASLSKK